MSPIRFTGRSRWRRCLVRVTAASVLVASLGMTGGNPAIADLYENQPDVELRNWFIGATVCQSDRNRYDVFASAASQPLTPSEKGGGLALAVGHRFGERFVLGLRAVVIGRPTAGEAHKYTDAEALLTGTVLFRQSDTLQPFLRGGIGATSLFLDQPTGQYRASGTAAIAGGGLQVRLGAGLCLEFEAVSTFANYNQGRLKSADGDEQDWDLRTSNFGWRVGAGVVIWF